MRIFTKSFLQLSSSDQAAVVDAVIDDLENSIVLLVNPDDEPTVRRPINRIRQRAIEHRVFSA